MASFNVKGPRPGLLTRIAGVAYNKYKMADAPHSVARKSELISMLSRRVRVGAPDTSYGIRAIRTALLNTKAS